MRKSLFILLTLIVDVLGAQTSFNYSWAHGFGAGGNEESYYSKVDGSGNILITGRITGTVDFDPGPGNTILDPGAYSQCFIAKYSSSGALIWADVLGTIGMGSSQGIIVGVDPSNNVYVTGFFNGVVDMDPGPLTQSVTAIGNSDLFMSKFDVNGSLVWTKNIGGASTQVNPNDMKINGTGDLLITGNFKSVVDFDASGNTYTLLAGGSAEDAFVMKYNNSGNFQWAFGIGQAASDDFGVGLDFDPSGNIYISGTFQSTVDFDPSGNTATITSNGAEDAFIAKYNSSGGYIWAGGIGGLGKEMGYRLNYTPSGELILSSTMQSAVIDADPSPGTSTLAFVGTAANNTFLGKYNSSNGSLIWAKNTGGNGTIGVGAYYINSDSQNNIYMCGFFDGTTDFDFTNGVSNLTALTAGGTDMFLAKYDSQGNYILAKSIGGGSGTGNEAYCLNITPSNDIILSGQFISTQDFDLNGTVMNETSLGGVDYFIAKYTQCISPTQPVLSTNATTLCGTTNTITLSITSGSLNSANNWVWSTGSCGTGSFATGNSVSINPSVTTTYFVRGEVGCFVPGPCTSASITVAPLKNISGIVTSSGTPVAGLVLLFKYEGGLQKYDSLDYATLDLSGNFTFTSVKTGSYILRAQPTATNLQSTYAGSAISWKGATVLTHGCVSNLSQNINVLPLVNIGAGPGAMSGKIVEGLKYGKRGAVSPGGPIKGLQVKCGRNPGSDMILQTPTLPDGSYSFTGLPLNNPGESYFILVDVPGLDTNGTYHKVITNAQTTIADLDFVADSAKITPGIYVGMNTIKEGNKKVVFYPNPTNEKLNIDFNELIGTKTIEIYSINGQLIFRQTSVEQKMELNLNTTTNGIYVIKTYYNDKPISENKLIKQ